MNNIQKTIFVISIILALMLDIYTLMVVNNCPTVSPEAVNAQPIPLVIMDLMKQPDALGRIGNTADPSNKGVLSGAYQWSSSRGINLSGDFNLTMQNKNYFPDNVVIVMTKYIDDDNYTESAIVGKMGQLEITEGRYE
jgi:hypothetical protein